MQYKALVVDFDRTLITSKDALPREKVKKAIEIAKNVKHIQVSIATARPFNKISKVTRELGLSGYSIVSGGAQLVDVSTGQYYYEYPLSAELAITIAKEILAIDSSIRLWIQDNGIDYPFDAIYKPRKPFIVVANALDPARALVIRDKLKQYSEIFCTRVPSFISGKVDINVSHKYATKKHGIETIAKILDISKKEIVGAGDGYNDFPLLQASGLRVAMGNAVPELKAIADFVAPTVEEDGIATVINTYF